MKKIFIYLVFIFLFPAGLFSSEFDELDKPPEGAHEGQILVGASFTLGWPYSSYIAAENDYLVGSTYTFNNGITKVIEVSHQSFAFSLFSEYMPLDHFGATLRIKRNYIYQNTNFGPDYENWKGDLYNDFSFFIGPTIHATTRKSWDFVFIPFAGMSVSEYHATPVARQIIDRSSDDTDRNSKGLSFGAELNCTIYFTGGLFISLGGEWVRSYLDLGRKFEIVNPQTNLAYKADTSGTIDFFSIVISAGYAFSN